MRMRLPLLISVIVLALLLAHHMHAPLATAATSAADPVAMAGDHAHHGVRELQVVDHGVLDDVLPELCTVGDPASPAPATTHGHVALASAASGASLVHFETASAPAWNAPVSPPDVLRALLQVFLN